MPVTHTNRKRQIYYLHQGVTKTGKPKYFFSKKESGNLVDEIPEGYEIYEHPSDAKVYLRRKLQQKITTKELLSIENYLNNIYSSFKYLAEAKGDEIIVYESEREMGVLSKIIGQSRPINRYGKNSSFAKDFDLSIDYQPMMKFTLDDEEERTFVAHRWCFMGSIDDWMYIGGPEPLKEIAQKYLRHLGSDSFYNL